MRRAAVRTLLVLFALVLLAVAGVRWLNERDEDPASPAASRVTASADEIARGAYLARAGNCMGCHTLPGGAAYAGGRGIPTPFGTIYASNLTPDDATGIGAWSADEFWRALHNGRARDGRWLYPAFPYPNYTRIGRGDADALLAYLRSLPPVSRPNTPHALPFPFDQQAALAVWRALYFRPEREQNNPAHDAEWNRGAYLVEGLGHCNACHASRNALGATASTLDLAGGLIPVQNWYAPSLTSASEAGVADWDTAHIVDLLKSGVSARGAVMGPMREVVGGSTQYLSDPDLRAMAAYLKALPQTPPEPVAANPAPPPSPLTPGGKLYTQHCVACHGEQGEGVAGIYPALAGSRAVTLHTPANLVHMVLEGGFPPSTATNPRPFGMPPFATVLNDVEVSQLLSYVRASWGNQATPVTALEVTQFRSIK
jgi:mono/diheme cytochrome c family protein